MYNVLEYKFIEKTKNYVLNPRLSEKNKVKPEPREKIGERLANPAAAQLLISKCPNQKRSKSL